MEKKLTNGQMIERLQALKQDDADFEMPAVFKVDVRIPMCLCPFNTSVSERLFAYDNDGEIFLTL
jgi:hypothetical protein